MNGKINLFISLIAIMFFSGCSLIKPRENTTPEQKEREIYALAKTATVVALNEINKDNLEEKVSSASQIVISIDQYAMPLLTNPEAEIDHETVNNLLALVPEEYQVYLLAAYELFNTNYSFPSTDEVLKEPYLSYVRALLKGVRDGAQLVLDVNNARISALYNVYIFGEDS